MSKRKWFLLLMAIVLLGSGAVGLAMWESKLIKATDPPVVTVEKDIDGNPKPTFKTEGDRLTAEMDLTFCWFATFTNKTTGLSHTLHNAYNKTGEHCR